MSKFYLRMEGVNQSNFVYEIQDLNTVRGGGLILLDAVETAETELGKCCQSVRSVTKGSSIGLFECTVADSVSAQDLCDVVAKALHGNDDFKHATFVIDAKAVGEENDFRLDSERMLALNRWRQMTAPQVAVPKHNTNLSLNQSNDDFKLDSIRPATGSIYAREDDNQTRRAATVKRKVSLSVQKRQDYGRNQKKTFAKETLQKYKHTVPVKFEFARHFDELSGDGRAGKLHHKMAVVYMDGNNFGKLQQQLCPDADSQKEFDEKLGNYRSQWLAAMVALMNDDGDVQSEKPQWLATDDEDKQRYRLEILQWGGDETCWVVPAWKGWELLSLLYRKSSEWDFHGEPLTHAAGLVFCHHKAPIQRIVDLAHELMEQAKEFGRDKQGRNRNLFAYEILESFDHIGRDNLEAYRRAHSPQPDDPTQQAGPTTLILSGETMRETKQLMAQIKLIMPRRKLTEIIRGLLMDVNTGAKPSEWKSLRDETNKLIDSTMDELKSEDDDLQKLIEQLGGERAWWIHLNALWDYV